eukprot:c16056_g1_i1.p1 GENE.c16056_g1_i1~~c16056_g1_i1.p1  ORF type:complete len:158 (+),score=30.02 c16056_g1_i1:61-534(+)
MSTYSNKVKGSIRVIVDMDQLNAANLNKKSKPKTNKIYLLPIFFFCCCCGILAFLSSLDTEHFYIYLIIGVVLSFILGVFFIILYRIKKKLSTKSLQQKKVQQQEKKKKTPSQKSLSSNSKSQSIMVPMATIASDTDTTFSGTEIKVFPYTSTDDPL